MTPSLWLQETPTRPTVRHKQKWNHFHKKLLHRKKKNCQSADHIFQLKVSFIILYKPQLYPWNTGGSADVKQGVVVLLRFFSHDTPRSTARVSFHRCPRQDALTRFRDIHPPRPLHFSYQAVPAAIPSWALDLSEHERTGRISFF